MGIMSVVSKYNQSLKKISSFESKKPTVREQKESSIVVKDGMVLHTGVEILPVPHVGH